MIYCTECPLYGLQSKKMLKRLLHIEDSRLFKQDYVASLISPYIDKNGKPRLIEPPSDKLKAIQKRMKVMLGKIIVPDNIFSGIKGRSYADNAFLHTSSNNRKMLFKIDLTAFFPTISREVVYRFFYYDLCCSPDVAEILTNFTTINIEKAKVSNLEDIYVFLNSKGVSCKNHLISGAPTSQILSYLVNHSMFDEMQTIASKNNVMMTVYVDDVTFSSEYRISHRFTEKVISIVRKYGYQISKTKVKKYTKLYPKLVTGVVIDSSGQPTLKNSMRLRIIKEYKNLQSHPEDYKGKQRLRGLLIAARQVNPHVFPNIYKFAFDCN
uniref:reverse transcriptase family protein n=1 Tax=Lachnoclostridium phocaeense TaxID=1871021 RepID=UPI0026DCB869|nr:reverse transcriptase family protein [Lachnoclostridium phocaeense]